MNPPDSTKTEADPRFPSGPWTGYFWQKLRSGRHRMTLDATFRDGTITAQGRDEVGAFTCDGSYDFESGKCRWTKRYVRKHKVTYAGVNEGQGIWGVWEINLLGGLFRDRGVFHIWPEGMTPDTETDLTERALLEGAPRGRNPVTTIIGVALLGAMVAFIRFVLAPWMRNLLR